MELEVISSCVHILGKSISISWEVMPRVPDIENVDISISLWKLNFEIKIIRKGAETLGLRERYAKSSS